jgi:hypothetical protein
LVGVLGGIAIADVQVDGARLGRFDVILEIGRENDPFTSAKVFILMKLSMRNSSLFIIMFGHSLCFFLLLLVNAS